MKRKRMVGLVVIGLIAGVTLGSIGIARAATASSDSTTTAQPGPGGGFGGRGMRGGRGMGGPGNLAAVVAKLTGIDVDDVIASRADGTSFAEIAKAKGVSADDIVDAALERAKTLLDARVKVGDMTADQADEALADLKERLADEVDSTVVFARRGMGGPGNLAAVVAKLTGIDVDDVIASRANGTSFAEIAKAKGVSADDIVDAALERAKTLLDARVKVGDMTADQADEALADLKERLADEVDSTDQCGPGKGGRRGGGMGGPRMGGGGAGGDAAAGAASADAPFIF